MKRAHSSSKLVAAILLVATPILGVPVSADVNQTALAGVVVSSADRSPVSGARVHMANTRDGSIHSSAVTDREGRFTVPRLPASSYEVAVEVGDGLYLVGSRVALAPGQTREIDLAVDDRQPAGRVNAQASAGGVVSAWNNPATAALIVLGSAFVVGALVEGVIDDDEPASTFTP